MKTIIQKYRKNFFRSLLTVTSAVAILLFSSAQLHAADETFTAGAYIINMSDASPNYGNGLKPYGLIYKLIVDKNVPIKWAIDQTKSKDGIDFSVDGTNYKAGSFIIPAEYINGSITAIFNSWGTVDIDGPTTTSFTAPIYTTLTSWPSTLVNNKEKKIVKEYFQHAGIPTTGTYEIGTPSALDDCHDLFLMPHSKPHSEWSNTDKTKFLEFMTTKGGYLWAACETTGNLEGEMTSDYFFLSESGLLSTHEHGDGNLNYTYDPAYDGDPIMQFMGEFDAATDEGSERIYMPKKNVGHDWRSTTSVAVYQPSHAKADPNEATVLVYGPTQGVANSGMVLYQAGHRVDKKGTTAEQVAGMRAFFNFILLAGVEKEITVNPTVPTNLVSGATINLSVSASGGSNIFDYEWTSTCSGGSFGSSTSASTTYTAPVVANATTCVISIKVTDNCGRFSYELTTVTVAPAIGPTAVNDNATTPMNTPVDITELANDIVGDAALDPTSISFVGALPDPLTEGVFSVHGTTGLVTFTPFVTFVGTVTVNYEVCDLNSLCDIATIVVVVTPVTGPTAVDDNATSTLNTPVDIIVLSNDTPGGAALDPTTVSFVAGTLPDPLDGEFTVDGTTGLVTFTPVNGFTGTATIDYEVCDLNSLCDEATITVVISVVGPTAVDDNVTTPKNTPVNINVQSNDTEGDATLDPTSVSFVGGTEPNPTTEGTFTVNPTTGLVTFTPVTGATGTVTIDYEVCDLNSLCSTATISVFISSGTDTDGDGCDDDVDDYPDDPTRCFNNYYPATGNGTLAYEDLWPGQGDYDFNDLVIDYRFMTVTNGNNHIVETFGTFIVKAFGASLENGFGFQLANNNIADADITTVTGYDLQEGYINLEANGIEEGQSKPTIIVYDNAFNILTHPGSGIGVNTTMSAPYVEPETLNIFISYTHDTYTLAELDIPNFNPFLIVDLNRSIEVHLPDYEPTDKADPSFFSTINDDSNPAIGKYYKTVNNLPWAIHITEPFEYPIEKADITGVYLKFVEWAESSGQFYPDWYRDEPGYRNSSLIYTHD